MSNMLITIWENTDGCAEYYRCVIALYLMSMLSQALFGNIDRVISVSGHGRELVDGLNFVGKRFLPQLMATVQLPGAKNYYTHTYILPFRKNIRLSKSQVLTKGLIMKDTKISDQTLRPCWY